MRKCSIDLAPDAPWRCPVDCPAFRPRTVESLEWSHGTLTPDQGPEEPPDLERGAARLLDEAEDIVNAALPGLMEELERERGRRPWWRRFGRRGDAPD